MILKIISPSEILFEGSVTSVTLPGDLGSFSVLENHASLISTLTAGDVICHNGDKLKKFAIKGGIADVDNNVVSVCIF